MCYNITVVIVSTKNENVKQIKKLKGSKGFLFLDNPKLILEACFSGFEIEWLVLKEGASFEEKNLKPKNKMIVSESVFKTICSTVSSQGAVAVVKFDLRQFRPPSGNFLVLDCVQDPGNVGTLIRSAVAFEFNEIYLIDCAKVSNEKVARSSMGAIFKAKLFEISKQTFLNEFKGKTLLCGELGGAPLSKEKLGFPLGVVVGNEGSGISKEVLALGKGIEIEMSKNVESLNAGVAGSILMSYCYNKFKNLKGENR